MEKDINVESQSGFEEAIKEPYYYKKFTLEMLENILLKMDKRKGRVKYKPISFTTENGHTITIKKPVI